MKPDHSTALRRLGTLGRWASMAAFAVCAAAPLQAWSQAYPNRSVTVVVPFAPGGNADSVARPLAAAMRKTLKQSVIIDNRAGAGGGVGAAYVARAKPDGYTLLVALSSISVTPVADRMQGRAASYELQQFTPIALLSADPTVWVVRADSPWKTLGEFFDDARKKEGKLSYSSSGVYGTIHVGVELMTKAAGVKLLHVPFNGGAPALAALLGGQVDAMIHTPSNVAAYVASGKLRLLAVADDRRLAAYPSLPTFKEAGVDVQYRVWSGLFAPAGTPLETVNTLRAAAKAAVEDESFRNALGAAGATIRYLDAPEFSRFWTNEATALHDLVTGLGKLD
jgi:tripartite-type tricarboxylate transporter receptor subunit TctC